MNTEFDNTDNDVRIMLDHLDKIDDWVRWMPYYNECELVLYRISKNSKRFPIPQSSRYPIKK